jgi:glutaminyl-tRNA synthetase
MVVLDPVKVIMQLSWGKEAEAENNQEDESAGYRQIPFSRWCS